MGFWKLAAALFIGASLTEGGRETLRRLAKEIIKTGHTAVEKTAATWDEVKSHTTQIVEEVKAEQKSGATLLSRSGSDNDKAPKGSDKS